MFAHALMRRAADIEAMWRRSAFGSRESADVDELRRRIGIVDVGRYRGIERFPFSEIKEDCSGWHLGPVAEREDPEPVARLRLQSLLGPDGHDVSWPRAWLSSLEGLLEVRDCLVAPGEFEIVSLGVPPEMPGHLLGFDVGYAGGGNFSILCDAALWPTWHPPDTDALDRLAAFVAQLNEHLLFPSAELAREYLAWYATQAWAEQPPEDFRIIAVGEVRAPRQAT